MTLDAKLRISLIGKENKYFSDMLTSDYFDPEAKELKKRIVDFFLEGMGNTLNLDDNEKIETIRKEYENSPYFMRDFINTLNAYSFLEHSKPAIKLEGDINSSTDFEIIKNQVKFMFQSFMINFYGSFNKIRDTLKNASELENVKKFVSEKDYAVFDESEKILLNYSNKINEVINPLVEVADDKGIDEAIQDDLINSAIRKSFSTSDEYKNFINESYLVLKKNIEFIVNVYENNINSAKVIDKTAETIESDKPQEQPTNVPEMVDKGISKIFDKVLKYYIEKRAKEIYE